MKFTCKFNVYVLYDVVSKDYGKPFFCSNDNEAIRIFQYACTGKMNVISANQFILYQLGIYDSLHGEFDNFKNNILVKLGSDLEPWDKSPGKPKVKSEEKSEVKSEIKNESGLPFRIKKGPYDRV